MSNGNESAQITKEEEKRLEEIYKVRFTKMIDKIPSKDNSKLGDIRGQKIANLNNTFRKYCVNADLNKRLSENTCNEIREIAAEKKGIENLALHRHRTGGKRRRQRRTKRRKSRKKKTKRRKSKKRRKSRRRRRTRRRR